MTIGLVNLFSPVSTITFANYADFEGVVLDGAQISSTDTGGNGAMSGVLGFRIERPGLPPLEGSVDYREVEADRRQRVGQLPRHPRRGARRRGSPPDAASHPSSECLGLVED